MSRRHVICWSDYMFVMQVIAHTHYINTHADTPMAKRVVPMSLHRYNWNLPRQAHGNQPYFACEKLGRHCSELRILAFSASVEELLGSSGSWHEFAWLLRGLAALGSALGRAVAWPSLPCNTSWVSRWIDLPCNTSWLSQQSCCFILSAHFATRCWSACPWTDSQTGFLATMHRGSVHWDSPGLLLYT